MMRGMRALLGVCVFVIAGLVALSTFSSGPPTTTALHSLVTQTHHQLNQLHKLKEELEGDQPLDNRVLIELGFTDNPLLFPNHSWTNISSPVIVSAIHSRHQGLLPELLKVSQLLSINASVVIYTLDLTEDEIKEVENECNETCILIQFDFSPFPSHVRDVSLGAYRPIIIQEMLQRTGVVFWLDPCMQVLENASFEVQPTRGATTVLERWVKKTVKAGGVLVWPLDSPAPNLPTAALTHPDMFPAFRTYKHNYDFQKMSDPRAALIVNTAVIHRRLMRPWVSCSLRPSCLSPIGAQDTGCRYNKKPLFRYSGCHLYDVSAFNVALGLTFGMDNVSYLDPTSKFICTTAEERLHSGDSSPSQTGSPPPSLGTIFKIYGQKRPINAADEMKRSEKRYHEDRKYQQTDNPEEKYQLNDQKREEAERNTEKYEYTKDSSRNYKETSSSGENYGNQESKVIPILQHIKPNSNYTGTEYRPDVMRSKIFQDAFRKKYWAKNMVPNSHLKLVHNSVEKNTIDKRRR